MYDEELRSTDLLYAPDEHLNRDAEFPPFQ